MSKLVCDKIQEIMITEDKNQSAIKNIKASVEIDRELTLQEWQVFEKL